MLTSCVNSPVVLFQAGQCKNRFIGKPFERVETPELRARLSWVPGLKRLYELERGVTRLLLISAVG
jgi:hypothetical protein